jgi:hypothetical protein
MFLKAVKMQVHHLLGKNTTIFTWFVIIGFVAYNFVENIIENSKRIYITQMFDPVKILTLSDWSKSGYFLMSFYLLILVIPTACTYLSDKNSQVDIYIKARLGSKYYFRSQVVSVFLVTFIIFTIPFLLEIILNTICFNHLSNGDPSNIEYFQSVEESNIYFMYKLLVKNRELYAIVMTLLFGFVTAILAVFNYALTTLKMFKFRIFTFFPIYILFYLISFVSRFLTVTYSTEYFFILRMFNIKEKNIFVYATFLFVLLIISNAVIELKIRKDELA